MHALLKGLLALATAAYPLLVYFGLGRWDPLWLALALATLFALRAWSGRDAVWLAASAGALLLGATASLAGSWLPLKLYPVIVSGVLLAVFGASVLRPPTVVERIARLREPELPPAAVAYTRKVTLAWCAFFLANGAVSAATAVWAGEAAWVLYNGLLSYVLVAAFFGGEWLVRQRHLARRVAHG